MSARASGVLSEGDNPGARFLWLHLPSYSRVTDQTGASRYDGNEGPSP